MDQTPLTVGSPQQVIDRTLGFREIVGDYQRQLFLVDHAGLPLEAVLEQMEMLGELVVPVLRREFATAEPAHVPDAPLHPRVAARRGRHGEPAAVPAPEAVPRMTAPRSRSPARRLVVVSAGLGQPSSTRLLSRPAGGRDRRGTCATPASSRGVEVIELRDHAQDLANHLLTGFPSPTLQAAIDAVLAADGLIAVTPDLQRVVQRPVQAVLRRRRAGRARRQAGPDRGDRRHGPPFAGARARDAAAVRLPERGRRRRPRSTPRPRTGARAGVAAEAASSTGSTARPGARGRGRRRAAGRPRDPFADPVPFEDLLSGGPEGRPARLTLTARARTASRGSASAGPSDPGRPPPRG